jgi:transglutaminase-like putative cysteine protease
MRTPERPANSTLGLLLLALVLGTTSLALADPAADPKSHDKAAVEKLLKSAQDCDGDLCRFSALQQVLKLDTQNEQASLALADYYIRREQLRPARAVLSKLLEQTPGLRAALLRIAKLDVREGRRVEALRRLRTLEPTADAEEALQIALGYESLEMTSDAARLGRRVIAEKPNDAQAQALLVRLAERLRDPDLLQQVNAPVPTKTTADTNLRAAWLGSEEPAESDAPYLADASALATQAPRATEATILADIRIDSVQPNGLAAKHTQLIVYLGNEAAVREYSTRKIQYEPQIEALSVLHALVHKPDGRVITAIDEGDQYVADLGASMYYDSRSRLLRFRGAETGDIVELEYRTRPIARENPYGDYFAALQTFQSSAPARLRRYVLIAATDRRFYITSERAPEPTETAANGVSTRVWEVQDQPALPSEPLSPAITERAPYVHISTLRDSDQLGTWYSQILEPQLALPAELKQVADEIRATTPDALERVAAIYHFVLSHSRYLAFEFGIHSYKPYPVAQVYARRFGDCKDDASLIVALLRAVGVDAEFALVRTRALGRVHPDAVSLSLFNHAMVYVPQFDLWLDGTAQYFGLRELPVEDQGAMAITVAQNGEAHRRVITVTRPEDNLTRRSVRAEIKRDGGIVFEGEQRTRGEAAPTLRRDYEHTEQQRDAMQRALAAVVPNVRLDEMTVQRGGKNDPEIDVSFQGVLDSAARDGHFLTLKTTWMSRDYKQRLASLTTRTQDLVLGAPWKSEENFAFVLPQGARVISTPAPVQIDGPFGKAALTYKVEKNELRINTAVEFRATRVRPEEYAGFRQFCAELDKAFRREVKLQLP